MISNTMCNALFLKLLVSDLKFCFICSFFIQLIDEKQVRHGPECNIVLQIKSKSEDSPEERQWEQDKLPIPSFPQTAQTTKGQLK